MTHFMGFNIGIWPNGTSTTRRLLPLASPNTADMFTIKLEPDRGGYFHYVIHSEIKFNKCVR